MLHELHFGGYGYQESTGSGEMSKASQLDVEGAYQMVPVYPDYRWLLDMTSCT